MFGMEIVRINTILNVILAIFTDYDEEEEDSFLWTDLRKRKNDFLQMLDTATRSSTEEGPSYEGRDWDYWGMINLKKEDHVVNGFNDSISAFRSKFDNALKRSDNCMSENCFRRKDSSRNYKLHKCCFTQNCILSHGNLEQCRQSSWSTLDYNYALLREIEKQLEGFSFRKPEADDYLWPSVDLFAYEFLDAPLDFLEKGERFAFGVYLGVCHSIFNTLKDKCMLPLLGNLGNLVECVENLRLQTKTGEEYAILKACLIQNFVVPIVVTLRKSLDDEIMIQWRSEGAPRPEETVDLSWREDQTLKEITLDVWKETCVKKVDPDFKLTTRLMNIVASQYCQKKELIRFVYKDKNMRMKARRADPHAWKKMVNDNGLEEFCNELSLQKFKIL
jgi:hypothetical protein